MRGECSITERDKLPRRLRVRYARKKEFREIAADKSAA